MARRLDNDPLLASVDTRDLQPRLMDSEGWRMATIFVATGLILGVPMAWASGVEPGQIDRSMPDKVWSAAFPEGHTVGDEPELFLPFSQIEPYVEPELPPGLLVVQAPPVVGQLELVEVEGEGGAAMRRAFADHRHALVACSGWLESGSFRVDNLGEVVGVDHRFSRGCLHNEVRGWGVSAEAEIELEWSR